ncbi:uncharacterized protein LOC112520169 [Cynara cardunculus var. scolymus]|uniref:uncharacterized protein LOC112520169 n=1 Tax=Cynara cardunculus var. scolymus TaxID=59895 RepID=UPI000D631140|nr:uncharacterized protein LOC112520169 [Cynara cardunculus var. scolymus]
MATTTTHHHHHHRRRPNSTINPIDYGGDSGLEINKSDVRNKNDDDDNDNDDHRKKPTSVESSTKSRHQKELVGKSLPVDIPDWSKISRMDGCIYKHHDDGYDDDGDDDDDEWLPPHEYLARTRMASLSVHEGIGRTLKGRDLSRVRNAIWKQTGFEQD